MSDWNLYWRGAADLVNGLRSCMMKLLLVSGLAKRLMVEASFISRTIFIPNWNSSHISSFSLNQLFTDFTGILHKMPFQWSAKRKLLFFNASSFGRYTSELFSATIIFLSFFPFQSSAEEKNSLKAKRKRKNSDMRREMKTTFSRWSSKTRKRSWKIVCFSHFCMSEFSSLVFHNIMASQAGL